MKRLQKGFTLVEVVLAIGIVAFGLVAVVGLLPTALTTHRAARDEAVKFVVGEHLHSRLRSVRFEDVPGQLGLPWFFDSDGKPTSPESAVYVVDVFLVANGGGLKQLRAEFSRLGADEMTATRFPLFLSNPGRP